MSNVLVIDDHPIVRDGLRHLLKHRPGTQVIAEAETIEQALEQAQALGPDLIVLDVTLAGENALDALPQLLALAPQAKVLVLSIHDDPCYVRQALAAGASGYLLKEAADCELLDALAAVEAGGRYMPPKLGWRVVEADERERHERETDPLTPRERAVVELLAYGYTSAEIGDQLGCSKRTIESHRAHLMHKLSLCTRAQLTRYAFDHGLARQPGRRISA